MNEIFGETLKEPLNSSDINYDSTTESNNLQFDASSCSDLDLKSSDDDVVNYEEINTSEVLYKYSNVRVLDFSVGFLVLCKRINISKSGGNILLDFIKTILAPINQVPFSYNQLIKKLTLNKFKTSKLCKNCLKENCICQTTQTENKILIHEFDVENQIRAILKKNWELMCNYNGLNFHINFKIQSL